MKRTIKFRAWINKNEMVDMMEWMPEMEPLKDVFNESIVMQFTGLLDKNGLELFENDYFEAEEPRFESGIAIYEVIYQQGCFWGVDKTKAPEMVDGFRNEMIPLFSFKELEIKGNKYENPELLTNN